MLSSGPLSYFWDNKTHYELSHDNFESLPVYVMFEDAHL